MQTVFRLDATVLSVMDSKNLFSVILSGLTLPINLTNEKMLPNHKNITFLGFDITKYTFK